MSKIYPKDFWDCARAIKFHFDQDSKYDAVQYRFKVGHVSSKKFEASPYFKQSVRLAKRCRDFDTARRYITANVLEGNTEVIHFDDRYYEEWVARMQSLSYHITSQCKEMVSDFNDLFVIDGTYPLIVRKFYEKKCSLETITCINKLVGFTDSVHINDPLLWPDTKYKIQQYTKLFVMDANIDKIRHQLVNTFK